MKDTPNLALTVHGMGPTPDGKFAMDLGAPHEIVMIIAENLGRCLLDAEAPNYVEWHAEHPEVGPMVLTLQRREGKSPHQFRQEAEAERDAIAAEIAGYVRAVPPEWVEQVGASASAKYLAAQRYCEARLAAEREPNASDDKGLLHKRKRDAWKAWRDASEA